MIWFVFKQFTYCIFNAKALKYSAFLIQLIDYSKVRSYSERTLKCSDNDQKWKRFGEGDFSAEAASRFSQEVGPCQNITSSGYF